MDESSLKIFMAVISTLGLISGIYNMVTTRTTAQEQAQKAKVEQALALGNENKIAITHLKETYASNADAINKRLDHIGADTSYVKDLVVKWLLDATRNHK